MEDSSMFNPSSPQARAIMKLFNAGMLIAAVIFTVVGVLVIYCAIRFRAHPGGSEPIQITGSRALEIGWTLIPFLTLVWLFVLTLKAMHAADPAVNRPADLEVTGHQWWWEVRYPQANVITANEIHLPAGQRLAVAFKAADVIHDFWVAKLARKIDLIPGHPNRIWLQADAPGTYFGQCAEYCGTQHAGMFLRVIAQQPSDFAKWETQQAQPAPKAATVEAQRGFELFQQMTCGSCHAIKGTGFDMPFAPDLTHLASRRTLGAGVIENTPGNLAKWLANPQTIKQGCYMPDFKLTAGQIGDLVSYLETLE